jgi:transposase-like protein
MTRPFRILQPASRRHSPAADLQTKRYTPDRWKTEAPQLSAWLETSVPESMTVFTLSPYLRRRLRTTNAQERLNREIKRRTRVAGLFPNDASLLRLVTAILAEIDEEWTTGRVYLNPNAT